MFFLSVVLTRGPLYYVTAHRNAWPKLAECFRRLVHQFLRMSKEQNAPTAAYGIHGCGHCFAEAGCVVEQRDGFTVVSHLLQRLERGFLMLLQLQICAVQRFAALHGEVVLDLAELRMATEKHAQLILDRLRLNLHLTHRPG